MNEQQCIIVTVINGGIADVIGPFESKKKAETYIAEGNLPDDTQKFLLPPLRSPDWLAKNHKFPRLVSE